MLNAFRIIHNYLSSNTADQLCKLPPPDMHPVKTDALRYWTCGAYLALEGERSMSADSWVTHALFPRARSVALGWRSSCESRCHGDSGKPEIQSRHSRLAVHRCPPCCRTRRASGRWSPWTLVPDSGWPSRTALWSSALMARRSRAVWQLLLTLPAHTKRRNAQITADCSSPRGTSWKRTFHWNTKNQSVGQSDETVGIWWRLPFPTNLQGAESV